MRKLPGSGKWLLNNKDYLDWKNNLSSQLLWVKGKQGCGKSYLASIVIDEIKTKCEEAENAAKFTKEKVAYTYAYFSSLSDDKIDISKVLMSMIEQLCGQVSSPLMNSRLTQFFNTHHEKQSIRITEVGDMFQALVGGFKEVYILVDGLDELRSLEDHLFDYVCKLFRNLTDTQVIAKVIVFSRPDYAIICEGFTDCPEIIIDEGENEQDIEKFIAAKLSAPGLHIKSNADLLKDVKQSLVSRSEGMFLWIDLVLKSLVGIRRPKDVRQKIRDVPSGLDKQYEMSMQQILDKDPLIRDLALKTILWITNAKEPLFRSGLLEALSVEPGMTDLEDEGRITDDTDFVRDCNDLIYVDKNGFYKLIHSSLKDYLTNLAQVPSQYATLQKQADTILAETCLTYLLFEKFDDDTFKTGPDLFLLEDANPLLPCAARSWAKHITRDNIEVLRDLATKLVLNPNRRNLSMHFTLMGMHAGRRIFAGPSTPFHILCIFNLVELAKTITASAPDLVQLDGFGHSPLDYACVPDNRDMCNYLLQILEDLGYSEHLCTGRYYPVYEAAARGWPDVVQKLIKLGQDPLKPLSQSKDTAVHGAAIGGSCDVLDVLTPTLIDINAFNDDGDTPLLLALEYGNLAFAKHLIYKGADVRIANKGGRTALHRCAIWGHIEIAQLLIATDESIVNAKDKTNKTALHFAARQGNISILRLLVSAKVDLDLQASHGITALHLASFEGHLPCVQALVEAGAQTCLLMSEIFTPLHFAAGNGHYDVVKLLLDQEMPFKLLSDYTEPPVLEAIRSGHSNVAKLLLEHDPTSVMAADDQGSLPLSYVARFGGTHPSVNDLLDVLLKYDAKIGSVNLMNKSALHRAAKGNNVVFLEELEKRMTGLDYNGVSVNGVTMLHMAAEEGFLEMVTFLLQRKVPQLKDDSGFLPLHRSVENGHLQVVEMLVSAQNINDATDKGMTALHIACKKGHQEIAACLLRHQANVDIQDSDGYTPLLSSICFSRFNLAHLLLDAEADANIASQDGLTPLHLACYQECESVTKRLLDRGCNPNSKDDQGLTALHVALNAVNTTIFELFISKDTVDWTVADNNGRTYLHHLATFGDPQRLTQAAQRFDLSELNLEDVFGVDPLCAASAQGQCRIFEVLSGIEFRTKRAEKTSPCIAAAYFGQLEALKRLISNGIINDQVWYTQETALHVAICERRPEAARLLIQAGADPLMKNVLGHTAVDQAQMYLAGGVAPVLSFHVKAQLLSMIRELLLKLLSLGDEFDLQKQHDRIDFLYVIVYALLGLGTEGAIKHGVVIFMELFYKNLKTESCQICKTVIRSELHFVCVTCKTCLCSLCYQDYQAEKMSTPPSLSLLEEMEADMRLLRNAIEPFVTFGVRFINLLRLKFVSIGDLIDKRHTMYKDWEQKYNADKRFDEYSKPGYDFLELFEDIHKTLGDKNVSEDAVGHLDCRLRRLFNSNRVEQEIDLFGCLGHSYVEVPSSEMRTDEQKQYFEDNKIKNAWFQDLIAWTFEAESECKSQVHEEVQDSTGNDTDLLDIINAFVDRKKRNRVPTQDDMGLISERKREYVKVYIDSQVHHPELVAKLIQFEEVDNWTVLHKFVYVASGMKKILEIKPDFLGGQNPDQLSWLDQRIVEAAWRREYAAIVGRLPEHSIRELSEVEKAVNN